MLVLTFPLFGTQHVDAPACYLFRIEQALCFHWLRLGLLLSGCCTQRKQPATNPVLKQRPLAAGVMRKFLSRLCSNVIFLILFGHGPVNIHVITSQILVRIYGFEIIVPFFKEPPPPPKKKSVFKILLIIYSKVGLTQIWVHMDEVRSLHMTLNRGIQ